ncbi:MAG TPA: hypothetical protein VHQ43_10170 [Solirubrobacterales bacterium]|jgi:hypothetical protein|nr:hypothetical protein [Solirubrobacterales bacterium]
MPGTPSADEAAAIAAAVERFIAETTAAAAEQAPTASPWQRAALVEGVGTKAVVQQHLEGGAKWLS